MMTVCTGWVHTHPKPIILKIDGDPNEGTSHGMCEQCQRDLGVAPNPAYEQYVREFPLRDPRD